MNKIDARSKSVRELLSDVKYTIDYYQREYKWETKHVKELLEDLEARFLNSYDESHERTQVENYANYFLGSIVISRKNGQNFIIDGQQRLTSLTLMLIYLNNLQKERDQHVNISSLIFSEKFGKKSFNLDVPERTACIQALYDDQEFDATGQAESVRNIASRYSDIQDLFPESLQGAALLYFIDWFKENVDMVEITAYSDDEAYTIFETMNDRGLSLSPTDMLKGYLLANIDSPTEKAEANEAWRQRLLILGELGKEEASDFFKAWLRAKYADSIRERKKGASNKDFEKIGTTFHKWVREEKGRIGLKRSAEFKEFILNKLNYFSSHYIRVRQAAQRFTPGMEYVFYNAQNNFTLQYPLVLAPLRPDDNLDTADRKIRLIAGFLDIFIARRMVNFRTLGYSAIVYTMFNLMKEIRDLAVPELVALLKAKVADMEETFAGVSSFYLHQMNRHSVHHLLARITYHIERESHVESSFETYVSREIKKPFEVEHIWANNYEPYAVEFPTEEEFSRYRNRFGGLILLPRGFNQSLGADSYEDKVKAYFGQNLLAKSLNTLCYRNNPSFKTFLEHSGLPFEEYPTQFNRSALDARQELYRRICEEIWSPARFDREMEG